MCFGGSTALLNDWQILLSQLSTDTQVSTFVNYYFTDTNGWNNWDTLMLDMEASDAKDKDPYNNLKSEFDTTLSLLYPKLKNIGKSLYLVVLPNQYNNYIGKMPVDGIISMNYNGSPGSAYKDYFTELTKSENLIIPALNPMYTVGGSSKAESVSTYLDLGFNIDTGCMLWASSSSCPCSTDLLIEYIDNFNSNTKSETICTIDTSNKGPCVPSQKHGTYTVKSGDICITIANNLCGPGYGGVNYYKGIFCDPNISCNLNIGETIKYDCSGKKTNCS